MRWYVRTLWGLGVGVVGLGLWMGLTGRKLYANVSVSLPPGLYVCQPFAAQTRVWRGEIVQLLPPPRAQTTYATLAPHEPRTAYWLKKVVANEGYAVCLHGDTVTLQGEVIAHRPLLTSMALAPVEGCWLLGPDDIFVLGEHPRSFDNRYTGPWTRDTIQGTCEPVWTWEATR